MADGAERNILGTFESAKPIGGVLLIRLVDQSSAGRDRYAIQIQNGREAIAALRNFDAQDDDLGF